MPMAVGGNIDWINRAVHLHWDLFIVNDTLVINSPSACGGDGDNSVKEPNLNLINGTDNAVYIWGTTNGDLIYVIPGNDNILFLSGDIHLRWRRHNRDQQSLTSHYRRRRHRHRNLSPVGVGAWRFWNWFAKRGFQVRQQFAKQYDKWLWKYLH